MSSPLVSVLIPSFNYARYLPEAIDSVLDQRLRDFELIVVDDASTDDSASVLQRYADRDERIRIHVNARNAGMVETWNDCLLLARGTFVKYLHADDMLAVPTALEQWVAMLDADPSIALAACAREIIDASSRRQRVDGYSRRRIVERGEDAIARCIGDGGNLIGEPSAVMFRRVEGQRGFDDAYRQLVDLEMWFHLLRRGKLSFTPSCLCRFRRHERQQSNKVRGAGVHQEELVRLMNACAPTVATLSRRRLLAGWRYRIRRTSARGERIEAALRDADRRLGAMSPAHEMGYRISRPLMQLGRRLRFDR